MSHGVKSAVDSYCFPKLELRVNGRLDNHIKGLGVPPLRVVHINRPG